jgi:4-amino-4-deoxy-L-arabinose transferase-like glycosyltransferase
MASTAGGEQGVAPFGPKPMTAPRSSARTRGTIVTPAWLVRLAPAWLGCLVLCAVINFYYFPDTITFPDEGRHLGSARRLAQDGEFWVLGARAWEMPGTAVFFALLIDCFGADAAVHVIRTAQSFLLVLQSILIGVTTRRVLRDERAATVAAVITAFYPFLLFYQGLLLSETLFNTLLIAAFASLYWWRDRGARLDGVFLLTCLCFAAATMIKPLLTVLPPLLLAAVVLLDLGGLRRAAHVLVVGALLHAALLSPWWIRNYSFSGTFVPLSTGAGGNFYLGNNPANPHAGVDWTTDVEHDVVLRIEGLPDEAARQRAYISVALEHIARDPTAFVERMARKFVRFWSLVPNAEPFSGGLYRVISMASFGPVLLLAIASSFRLRRQWRLLAPIYLLIAYVTLLHMVTIASLRYRLPLEPFLVLLAAEPLARASRRMAIGAVRKARPALPRERDR